MGLHSGSRRTPIMRTKLIMLSSAAALLVTGGTVFEAKATMGGGTESFSAQVRSYLQIEKASCSGKGLFCQSGSTLQCKPLCVCLAPLLRECGSSITKRRVESS